MREHTLQARMRSALERPLRAALTGEFDIVAKDASANLHRLGSVLGEHKKRLAIILHAAYSRIIRDFGGKVLAEISADGTGKSYDQWVEECKEKVNAQYAALVKEFTKKWTAKRVTSISTTTRNKLSRIIDKGTREGLGERELGGLIEERIGGDFGARRARTIARTETHAASQDAQFEVAQDSGLSFVKEWVAVTDDRTREDHAEANGQQVAMHETFKVGDDELLYPGDPSGSPEEVINCRCVCVYEPV